MEAKLAEAIPGAQTERRIARLTLLFGFGSAAIAAVLHRKSWPEGLAVGAALAWLNFRWLRRGLDALVVASKAQEGREKPRVPLATYSGAMLRYGLLALCVYVIFKYLDVPLGSMIVGLCALAVAAIAASLYEILHRVD